MAHLYTTVLGTRVNLTYIAIFVAIYDIYHIIYELKEKYNLFWLYQSYGIGCSKSLSDTHCVALYGDIAVYILDFIFTSLLIYGSTRVEKDSTFSRRGSYLVKFH